MQIGGFHNISSLPDNSLVSTQLFSHNDIIVSSVVKNIFMQSHWLTVQEDVGLYSALPSPVCVCPETSCVCLAAQTQMGVAKLVPDKSCAQAHGE